MTALSVDAICAAVEQTLTAHMATALTAQGVMLEAPTALDPITAWAQIPTRQALYTSELPAGSITSPGLAGPPIRDESGGYTAVWTVGIAVFARGTDYRDTTQRVRAYAAAVRDVIVTYPTLGGAVLGSRWTHEEYALLDSKAARTEGGCLVEIEVQVQYAVTPGDGTNVPVSEATAIYSLLPVHPAS
jgi:hypothetical protein